jgi:hypothetical protein
VAFFDLAVHRFHDQLALCVDPGSLLASELARHARSGIGIVGHRSSLWQAADGDVGVDALIGAGFGVVLPPVAHFQRHHIRPLTSAGGDALQHRLKVLSIRRLVAHPHRQDHLVVAIYRQLAVVALSIGLAGLHLVAVGICEISLGLGLHLLAGLTDFCEGPLLVAQLIMQLAAKLPLAVALVYLSNRSWLIALCLEALAYS